MNCRSRLCVVLGVSFAITAVFFFLGSTSYGLVFSARNLSLVIRLATTISVLFSFYLLDYVANLQLRMRHYVFVITILLAGVMLSPLYFLFGWYDKVLHLIQPMFLASIVLYIVTPLNISSRWKFFFTFFVVLGGLGLFEVGEYLIDVAFDSKLQGVFRLTGVGLVLVQSRIDDTIVDLLFGVVSTLVYLFGVALFWSKKH